MTYTITLSDSNGNEVYRNYHEVIIDNNDKEYIGEQILDMKDTIDKANNF